MMTGQNQIVFFDMDHTLIDNDCDVSWKDFLVREGLADSRELEMADAYFERYRKGTLPIDEFLAFQLRQFIGRTPEEMRPLAQKHFDAIVRPLIYPQAERAVRQAREKGFVTSLLTATNGVIAQPLADAMGLDHVVATELEIDAGRFTGRIIEPYCFEENKITLAKRLCRSIGARFCDAIYYGDSRSDLPALEKVATPILVNPAPALLETGRQRGWRIEQWSL